MTPRYQQPDPSFEVEFKQILDLDDVRELQESKSRYTRRKLRYRIASYLLEKGLISTRWFERIVGGFLLLLLFDVLA